MPLSIDKSSIMHCGKRQPHHEYTLGQVVIKNVDSMMDLDILRTADVSYSNHCQAIATKASRTAGAIRHAFRSRDPNLMWAAFQFIRFAYHNVLLPPVEPYAQERYQRSGENTSEIHEMYSQPA